MKKFIIGFIIFSAIVIGLMALAVHAAPITPPTGGGTGLSSASSTGTCLIVSSTNPFTYYLGTCGSGGGSSTTLYPGTGIGVTASGTNGYVVSASATISYYVAASNATAAQKAVANYICTGTNDNVCIQNAVNAASSSSPGNALIQLSPGTFYIASSIIISRGNIQLQGSGWNTQLFADNGLDAPLITTASSSLIGNGLIQNMQIYGNRTNESSTMDCLDMDAIDQWTINDNWITQCPNTGLALSGTSGGTYGYNNTVTNNLFDGNGQNGITMSSNDENYISGNLFKTLTGDYVQDNADLQQVTHNTFEGVSATSGIAFWSTYGTTTDVFSDNVIDGIPDQAVYSNGGGNVITGNYFYNCASVGTTDCILLKTSPNTVVSNNYFGWNSNYGINGNHAIDEQVSPTSAFISGNYFASSTAYSYAPGFGTTDNAFLNYNGTSTPPSGGYWVQEDASSNLGFDVPPAQGFDFKVNNTNIDSINASGTVNANGHNLTRAATEVVCASNAPDTTNCDYFATATSSNVAFQAAINAYPGAQIVASAGTFTFATTTFINASGTTITCQGPGATTFNAGTGLNGPIFQTASTTQNVTVQQCKFNGENQSSSVDFEGVDMRNSFLQNNWFTNASTGILLSGDSNLGWYNTVSGNDIDHNGIGTSAVFDEYNYFLNNSYSFNSTYSAESQSDNDKYAFNTFDDTQGLADLYIPFGVGQYKILDNTFTRFSQYGLLLRQISDSQIIGNTFDSIPSNYAAIQNGEFGGEAGSRDIFSDNSITGTDNATSTGIAESSSSTNNIYEGNTLQNVAIPISLNGSSTNYVIEDNRGITLSSLANLNCIGTSATGTFESGTCSGGGGGGVTTSSLGTYAPGSIAFFTNSSTITATSGFEIASATGAAYDLGTLAIGSSSNPVQFFTVGTAEVADTGNSKAYRFRTTGSALDFEASGAAIDFSDWSTYPFSGTQYNYFSAQNGSHNLYTAGNWLFQTGNDVFDHNGTNIFIINGDSSTAPGIIDNATTTNILGTLNVTSTLTVATNTYIGGNLNVTGTISEAGATTTNCLVGILDPTPCVTSFNGQTGTSTYVVSSANSFISVATSSTSSALTFSSSSLNLGSASTHPSTDFLASSTSYSTSSLYNVTTSNPATSTTNGSTTNVTVGLGAYEATDSQGRLTASSTLASSSVTMIFGNATTTAPAFQDFQLPDNATLYQVSCSEYASATTTLELFYSTSSQNNTVASGSIILSSINCTKTQTSTTSFTTSTIPAGDWFFGIVSSTVGTPQLTTISSLFTKT